MSTSREIIARGALALWMSLWVGATATCSGPVEPPPGPQVRMEPTGDGFYAMPFPGPLRQDEDGTLDVDDFPNPYDIPFVRDVIALGATELDGASLNGGAFFQLTGPVDPAALPDPFASREETSPIWFVDVDPASPERGERHAFTADYRDDGGPHGAAHLLAVLPVQGRPLRPATRYAVAVRSTLTDPEGHPVAASPTLRRLAGGEVPDGMSSDQAARFHEALDALSEAGLPRDEVAGLTVFVTADPVTRFDDAVAFTRAQHLPAPPTRLRLQEVFDDFCTFHATLRMPVYQQGEPPYTTHGGGWALDADGDPVLQETQAANVWVTLPRGAVPAAGVPLVVFIRTGGGGDRPLVDRGRHAEAHGEAVEPGEGPARYFARAGFAGFSVDGPHGGLRNVTGGDEQFLMFNFMNPAALRDNVRQSALELALLPDVLAQVTVDASGCPGVTGDATDAIPFDLDHLALMGHSMGATIAPLVAAVEPRYRALILSGAGGSWIENIIYKQSPLEVRPVAELLLEYNDYELHEHDPIVSLVQWAADPAEPLCYLRRIGAPPQGTPPHVLMFQGIVDTYIMPPIANAYSLGFGLDSAGPVYDAENPELADLTPLGDLLPLSGRSHVSLPVSGNLGGSRTGVVVQHPEDGIEDGHEVVFQTPLPKAQYQCFLRTWLRDGVPYVPAAAGDPECE